MSIETQAQFKIKTQSPFEAKARIEHLMVLSRLDSQTLSKLAELSQSQKAVSQINDNFKMIKNFLG